MTDFRPKKAAWVSWLNIVLAIMAIIVAITLLAILVFAGLASVVDSFHVSTLASVALTGQALV